MWNIDFKSFKHLVSINSVFLYREDFPPSIFLSKIELLAKKSTKWCEKEHHLHLQSAKENLTEEEVTCLAGKVLSLCRNVQDCSSKVMLMLNWFNSLMVGLTRADHRLGAAVKSCKGPLSGFLCSVNLFILCKTEWNVRAAAEQTSLF